MKTTFCFILVAIVAAAFWRCSRPTPPVAPIGTKKVLSIPSLATQSILFSEGAPLGSEAARFPTLRTLQEFDLSLTGSLYSSNNLRGYAYSIAAPDSGGLCCPCARGGSCCGCQLDSLLLSSPTSMSANVALIPANGGDTIVFEKETSNNVDFFTPRTGLDSGDYFVILRGTAIVNPIRINAKVARGVLTLTPPLRN